MWLADIVTPWVVDARGQRRPRLLADHPYSDTGESYQDVTGQASGRITPDPNLFVGRFRLTPARLDAIEADDRYQSLAAEEEAGAIP